MGLEFLDNCKLGVLQMVVVRTCTTMAAAVSLARESRHQEESRKFFQGLESSLTTLTLRPSFALLLLLLLAAATAIVLAVLLPPLPLLTRCATTAGPSARAPSTPIAASSGSRSPTHAPPASPSTRSSCSTGHAARKWLGPSPWPSFLPSRLRPPPNSSCGPRQGRFLLKKDCSASPTFPLMASLNTPNTWQAIVFLSFWQGVVLHGLVDRGVITGYGGGHDGATERARAVKDMLVCAEVSPSLPPTFSFLHYLEGKLVTTNFFFSCIYSCQLYYQRPEDALCFDRIPTFFSRFGGGLHSLECSRRRYDEFQQRGERYRCRARWTAHKGRSNKS